MIKGSKVWSPNNISSQCSYQSGKYLIEIRINRYRNSNQSRAKFEVLFPIISRSNTVTIFRWIYPQWMGHFCMIYCRFFHLKKNNKTKWISIAHERLIHGNQETKIYVELKMFFEMWWNQKNTWTMWTFVIFHTSFQGSILQEIIGFIYDKKNNLENEIK